jgi:hypothetical protein
MGRGGGAIGGEERKEVGRVKREGRRGKEVRGRINRDGEEGQGVGKRAKLSIPF